MFPSLSNSLIFLFAAQDGWIGRLWLLENVDFDKGAAFLVHVEVFDCGIGVWFGFDEVGSGLNFLRISSSARCFLV